MQRLRAAFTRHHALQCGYCTPGMLATSRDIVLRLPQADEQGAGGAVRQSVPLHRLHGHRGRRDVRAGRAAGATGSRRGCAACRPGAGPGRRARDRAAGGLRGIHAGGGWRRGGGQTRVRSRRRASRQEGRPGQPDRRRFHRALSRGRGLGLHGGPAGAGQLPARRLDRGARGRPGQEQDRHQVRTHVRRLQWRGPPGARRCRHAGGVPGRRAGLAQPVARQWRHHLSPAGAVARRDAGAREPAVFAAGAWRSFRGPGWCRTSCAA